MPTTPISIPPEDAFKYKNILPKHLEYIPDLRERQRMPRDGTWMPYLQYVWAKPGEPQYITLADGQREEGPMMPSRRMIEIPKEDWEAVRELTGVTLWGATAGELRLYLTIPVV
jgi:hypothetical protein